MALVRLFRRLSTWYDVRYLNLGLKLANVDKRAAAAVTAAARGKSFGEITGDKRDRPPRATAAAAAAASDEGGSRGL